MPDTETPKEEVISPERLETSISTHLSTLIISLESLINQKIKAFQESKNSEQKIDDQKKGKTLSGFLEFTSYFSTQASSANRTLALAGVAIIWIFKKPDKEIIIGLLNFPLWCLAISLSLDLLQYALGAIAWNIFYERKYFLWKKGGYEPSYVKDIQAPNAISWPITSLFVLKIIFMGIAYWHIIKLLLIKF